MSIKELNYPEIDYLFIMNRRRFLETISLCTSAIPFKIFAKDLNSCAPLKILRTEIKAGLNKSLRFLHVSDSHNVIWDNRTPFQEKFSKIRRDRFSKSAQYWEEAVRYSKEKNLPILHTGDLCDFYNPAMLDFVKESITNSNIIAYAVGNHELSKRYGTFKDGLPNAEIKKNMQNSVGTDIEFSSKIVGGLNVISLSNGFYQFTEFQLERLNEEIKRGLPILILCHIPIYSEAFFEKDFAYKSQKLNNTKPKKILPSLIGIQTELLEGCNSQIFAFRKSTNSTAKLVEILQKNPLIKGILCGHVHHTIVEKMPSGALQVCVAGGFDGWVNEITIS